MTVLQLVGEMDVSRTGGLTDFALRRKVRHIRVAKSSDSYLHLTTASPRAVQSESSSPWLPEVEAEIRSYLELPPDWDTYGGGPAAMAAVGVALSFATITAAFGFSRPDTWPQCSGGVLLQWQDSKSTLILDFEDNGDFSFLYERVGQAELQGGIEEFFRLLGIGLQPF